MTVIQAFRMAGIELEPGERLILREKLGTCPTCGGHKPIYMAWIVRSPEGRTCEWCPFDDQFTGAQWTSKSHAYREAEDQTDADVMAVWKHLPASIQKTCLELGDYPEEVPA